MTTRAQTLLLCIGLLCVVGCKNPAADAPKATVAEAAPAAKEAPSTGHEPLALSLSDSQVSFVGSKITGKHDGGFKQFSGTIHLLPTKLDASRIEVEIEMDSVWTDSDRLTGHLKSGDFFLVEQHPHARFVSTRLTPGAEGKGTHTITGNLTLRGVTQEISFPAAVAVSPQDVRAEAEFSLPRKQFGVAFEGKPDDLIRDEVLIRLTVVAPRSPAGAAR